MGVASSQPEVQVSLSKSRAPILNSRRFFFSTPMLRMLNVGVKKFRLLCERKSSTNSRRYAGENDVEIIKPTFSVWGRTA
jgi:hypothetical protein